jgi:hypothetical protein
MLCKANFKESLTQVLVTQNGKRQEEARSAADDQLRRQPVSNEEVHGSSPNAAPS